MTTNVLSVKEKIVEDLFPALVSGAISVLGYTFLFGESAMSPIEVFGLNIPAGALIFSTTFGSHLVSNVLENNVLDLLKSEKASLLGMAAKPVLGGLAQYGLIMVINGNAEFMNSFLLGAGSIVGGEYVYDSFLKK